MKSITLLDFTLMCYYYSNCETGELNLKQILNEMLRLSYY